jgi:hypothetical protein
MYQVPDMITILIAGADDDIEEKETDAASKMTKLRSEMGDDELHAYYHEVNEHFDTVLRLLLDQYPRMAESRNPIIAKQLEEVNTILAKLEPGFAASFYKSIKSFAKRVAESAGGVLGFASVSKEEKQWMGLDMITEPGQA